MSVFIGESCICPMVEVWADRDLSDFDCNTIILGSEDNGYNQSFSVRGDIEYILLSGLETIKHSTDEKIIEFIYPMNEKMNPNVIALEENYT